MAQTFSLGALTFTGWEVAQDLKLPRRTLMSVHEIPQTDDSPAEKIGQTFGTFSDPITIDGTFLGDDADDRLRQLESLQDAQAVVPFTSGTRVFDVLIAEVEPTYHSLGEINFTATLEPLLDRRAGNSSITQDASSQLSSALVAISDASAAVAPGLDPSIYASLAAVSTQQSQIGTLTLASVEDQIAFAQTLYNAMEALKSQLMILRETTGVSNTVQQLEGLSGALASAYRTLQTYTGQSAVSPSIRVANTTAYAVAAQYTGDWQNFRAIMDANGLVDPMITDPISIKIPRV